MAAALALQVALVLLAADAEYTGPPLEHAPERWCDEAATEACVQRPVSDPEYSVDEPLESGATVQLTSAEAMEFFALRVRERAELAV